jgi:hypothetical protein
VERLLITPLLIDIEACACTVLVENDNDDFAAAQAEKNDHPIKLTSSTSGNTSMNTPIEQVGIWQGVFGIRKHRNENILDTAFNH